jgi:hypothetical protein
VIGALLLAALAGGPPADAPPAPWIGRVRVEGPTASGPGPFWDPALSPGGGPAADRELAFDLELDLAVRHGAWFRRLPVLGTIFPPRPVDPEALEADRQVLERVLRQRGWPNATVTVAIRPGRSERSRDVAFVVDHGPDAGRYRPPRRRETPRPPGWTLSPLVSALGRGTPVSAYVGVDATWRSAAEGASRVDLRAEVGGRAFLEAGTPESLFAGDIGPWADLRAGVRGRAWGDLDLVARAQLGTEPWPAHNELRAEAEAGVIFARGDLQTEAVAGAGRWTSWPWPAQTARYEAWVGDGPSAHFVPDYGFVRADLRLVLDTTDRAVAPRTGVRLALDTTPIGLAEGSRYHRADVDARAFVPLVGRRVVLGLRGRAGALDWHDPEGRKLLGERFFLGVTDLRAWGRRRVFPPDFQGERSGLRPGGDAVLYGNAELRWHLHRDLSLAAFVDAGRVWDDVGDVRLGDLLLDVGASGAAPSPLGLVRVDVAWRATSQPVDLAFPVEIQLQLSERW